MQCPKGCEPVELQKFAEAVVPPPEGDNFVSPSSKAKSVSILWTTSRHCRNQNKKTKLQNRGSPPPPPGARRRQPKRAKNPSLQEIDNFVSYRHNRAQNRKKDAEFQTGIFTLACAQPSYRATTSQTSLQKLLEKPSTNSVKTS